MFGLRRKEKYCKEKQVIQNKFCCPFRRQKTKPVSKDMTENAEIIEEINNVTSLKKKNVHVI